MPVSAEALRTHLDYSRWASRKLVEAASVLRPEQLIHDFQTADGSILGTLVHIFAADRLWLGRLQANPPARFLDPEKDMRLAVLQNDWPSLGLRWRDWAQSLSDASIRQAVSYRDLAGNPYQTPLWQIVLHVVNHASHHRGQVSGFLRSLGHTPPPIDLIYFYREQG